MAKRNYYTALKKALDGASANQFADRTKEELADAIAGMTKTLIGPMSNAERIMLAADREAARKALAAHAPTHDAH